MFDFEKAKALLNSADRKRWLEAAQSGDIKAIFSICRERVLRDDNQLSPHYQKVAADPNFFKAPASLFQCFHDDNPSAYLENSLLHSTVPFYALSPFEIAVRRDDVDSMRKMARYAIDHGYSMPQKNAQRWKKSSSQHPFCVPNQVISYIFFDAWAFNNGRAYNALIELGFKEIDFLQIINHAEWKMTHAFEGKRLSRKHFNAVCADFYGTLPVNPQVLERPWASLIELREHRLNARP